jgi:uncharacterized protein
MTLFFDTSAVIACVIEGPNRSIVHTNLDQDEHWCASNLALAEALALVPRLTDEAVLQDDIEDAIRLLWDRLAIVPVDQAIHLAAAERLVRPIRFMTFDPAQIPVALSLGFDVISS